MGQVEQGIALAWTVAVVVFGFDPTNANRPVNTTFAYDPLTDRWATRAPMPTPRGALACVVIGNLIYAAGGASPAGDSNVNEAYDPASDPWRLDLAPMPTESQHLAAAELGGLLHVFGGRSVG